VKIVGIVAWSSGYRLPFGIAKEPGREDDQDSIKNYKKMRVSTTGTEEGDGRGRHTEEDENQPNVSPPILEPDVQRGVILIPNRDGAIPTERGFGGVIQVATKVLDEIVGPASACLT